jgi:hypothetical protein
MKSPSRWGRNLRRADAKAEPSHLAQLYYIFRLLASLSDGGDFVAEGETTLLTDF